MRSFQTPNKRRKVISLILIWFLSAGLGTVFHLTDALAPAERLVLDRKFLLFQREYERDDIALIAIDASSLDRFSSEFNLYWPWPREMYGMLLDYLDEAGAKTVTFDILFDRPDIDRLDTEGPVSDRRFAESIYNSGNVVIAINSVPATDEEGASGNSTPSGNLLQDLYRHAIPSKNSHPVIPPMRPVNIPISPIRIAARQLGNAYIPTRHDGVIRSTYLLMPAASGVEEGLHIPSLPMAAWLTGTAPPPQALPDFRNGRLHIHNRSIPLQPDGTYRINWYARGGVRDGTFPYYSFYDVFRSGLALMQDRSDRVPLEADLFRNRHVVIGASAAGLADIKTTPFSALEPYPGMEIQATVLANLLDGEFLEEMAGTLALLLLWVILLPVIFGIGTLRHVTSLSLALIMPLLVISSGLAAFALVRLVLPTVFFTLSLLAGIGATYIYRYLTEERQKKVITSAFSQYIQKEFVDRIAEDPGQLRLGGQQKELTVLFSDMADFTSISEKLEPQELSYFLNDYLTDMTRIVFDHGGTLDKFIGDAIMAFWGAPIDQEDHALRACRCALAMQHRLDERSREWSDRGYPPVSIRIGINTGPMIVGNMGSRDRFNYTVLGDAVNLGARLEPLNKQFGTKIIISEFTLRHICKKDPEDTGLKVRELDRITVKGKSRAVTIHEIREA